MIICAIRWSIHPSFLKYVSCHYLWIYHFNLFGFMHADSFCRFGLEAIGENAILLWSRSTDCESLFMCQSKQSCFSFFLVILSTKIVLILKHALSKFLPQYVEGVLNNRNTFFRTSEQMDVTISPKNEGLFLLFYFSKIFSRFLHWYWRVPKVLVLMIGKIMQKLLVLSRVWRVVSRLWLIGHCQPYSHFLG